MVYVNSVSQVLIVRARRPPKAEDRFCRFFRVGFLFRFFLEVLPKPNSLLTVYYLKVKFLPFA